MIPITTGLALVDRTFEIEVGLDDSITVFPCALDAMADRVTCTSPPAEEDAPFDVQLDVDLPGPAPAQLTLRIDRVDDTPGPDAVVITIRDDIGQLMTTRKSPSRTTIATERGRCESCAYAAFDPLVVP